MFLHIYLRQTSHNNPNPNRPHWFNYEKCFKNLLDTIDFSKCKLTVIFDGDINGHFTQKYQKTHNFSLYEINSHAISDNLKDGWSHSSQLAALKIEKDNIPDEDIIYIVENDYLHLPGWTNCVLDVFNANCKHQMLVGLFDHLDKYVFTHVDRNDEWGMYKDLVSKIFVSNTRHWRTVPSICHSWIMSGKSFKENKDVFYSGVADNTGSDMMGKRGYIIITPIPSLANHCDLFNAPLVNWENVSNFVNI
jgi:hypothetical protein